MKNRLWITLCLLICASCSAKAWKSQDPLPVQELQVTLDAYREAGGLIGVSAAIIDREGNLWSGVSGNSYPGHPVSPDMVFDMGSAGKNLAAALMLDLAEEGLIDLDHPLEAYIVPPPGVDGSIPIRSLLNHTSGLANVVEHPDSPTRTPYHLIEFDRWWEIEELFTDLGAEPYFLPGAGWHYSQAGYQIATLIVEEVTGLAMAEAVQTRLLDPLDIHGMVLDMSRPLPEGVEMAHNWVDVKGFGIPQDMADKSRNWIASIARITYYTTAEDFARWGHALFSGQVLELESLEEMLDFVQISDYGNEPPIFTGYGLGAVEWIPEMLNGQYGYGHSGSIPGYRAFMAYLPEHQLTIAVLSNTNHEQELGALINALLAVALGESGDKAAAGGLDLNPNLTLPDSVQAVRAFSNQKLFCDQEISRKVTASPEQPIDLSLDWVVATDADLADEIWEDHTHRISFDRVEIQNLVDFTREPILIKVACPEGVLEMWSKGLSIFLPPLPPGEYQIVWHSLVKTKFQNGYVEYRAGDNLEAWAELTVLPES